MGEFPVIVIMIITYSHDIATAVLAVSGIVMLMLSGMYEDARESDAAGYFVSVFRGVVRLAKYSLIWIIIAGVPRIFFYRQMEWSSMAGDLQVVAIIIKHIVMFLIVGLGLFYWARLEKKVRHLKENIL